MPYQRWHQKGVDKQDKTEVEFLCLHLSSIFGHNMTHVLGQSLTSFSVIKQGTRLSNYSATSRHTFPTAFSLLFSMKISFSNDITVNPHHDFGLRKQEVSHLLAETTFLLLFL